MSIGDSRRPADRREPLGNSVYDTATVALPCHVNMTTSAKGFPNQRDSQKNQIILSSTPNERGK